MNPVAIPPVKNKTGSMKSHNVFAKLKVLMMGILVTERGCFGYGKAAIWDATSRLDFYLTTHTKATTKLDYLTTHTKADS